MTSFVAWVGVDARGPASIYLASDSRISWVDPDKTFETWDYGRKLFASKKYPEIFGYFGDTLFPSQMLGQVLDLIEFKRKERKFDGFEGVTPVTSKPSDPSDFI